MIHSTNINTYSKSAHDEIATDFLEKFSARKNLQITLLLVYATSIAIEN